jgi:hypothetical protein
MPDNVTIKCHVKCHVRRHPRKLSFDQGLHGQAFLRNSCAKGGVGGVT